MISEQTLNKLYHYCSAASDEEFEEDITRILFIFRLINRFISKRDTNYHLLINHMIIFWNVFGIHSYATLLEYCKDHKYKNVEEYLNSVLRICSKLDTNKVYNQEFYDKLEKSINDHSSN